jgi:hypothetical protein
MKLSLKTATVAAMLTVLAMPAYAQMNGGAGSSGTQQRRDENSGRANEPGAGPQTPGGANHPAASPDRSPQAGTGGEGGGATTTDRNRTGTDPRSNPGTTPR